MIVRLAKLVWPLPYTLVGWLIGVVVVGTGGGMFRRGLVWEFHGGALEGAFRRLSRRRDFVAMTLGHTILARSRRDLELARRHELVHVGQYERWGLIFPPAYLLCSLALWLKGRDAYRDNPFERQAYRVAG